MATAYTEEHRQEQLLSAIPSFASWFFSHFMDFSSQPKHSRVWHAIGVQFEEYKSKSKLRKSKAKDLDPDSQVSFDFSLLPTEIRLQVWEIIATAPRAVILRSPFTKSWKEKFTGEKKKRKITRSRTWWTNTPVPSVLHVNKESRRVGLKYYKRGLASGWYNPIIYINYSSDWILLGKDEMKDDCCELWSKMQALEQIEGLIASYYGIEGFLNRLNTLDVTRRFSKLEDVLITRSRHLKRSRLPRTATEDMDDWIIHKFEHFGIAWLRLLPRDMRLELHWCNAKRQRGLAYFDLIPNGQLNAFPTVIYPQQPLVTP